MNSFVYFPHMKTSCFTLHQQTKFYYWSTNNVCFRFNPNWSDYARYVSECFNHRSNLPWIPWGSCIRSQVRRPPLSDYVGCCSTFCLSCKAARHSSDHPFQNRSHIHCACFHLRLAYRLFWSNTPGGRIGFLSSVRRWFGVKDTWLLGYLGDGIASATETKLYVMFHQLRSVDVKQIEQHLSNKSDHAFPSTTMMWGWWWVETPLCDVIPQ